MPQIGQHEWAGASSYTIRENLLQDSKEDKLGGREPPKTTTLSRSRSSESECTQ